MALIIDGKEYPISVPCIDWRESGLHFKVGENNTKERKEEVDLFVIHWTGGEGDEHQLFRVLDKRELGVEFFIRDDGTIFQFADPVIADTADAGFLNPRSIGVEIQNYGYRRNPASIPKKGRNREVYYTTMRGRRRKFAAFTPEQRESLLILIEAIINANHPRIVIPRKLLRDENGEVFTGTLRRWQLRNFSGVIGHFQFSKNKSDPGTKVLHFLDANGYT